MKRIYILIAMIMMILVGCNQDKKNNIDYEDYYESDIKDTNYIELKRVAENAWMHTSYAEFNGYTFPANGLIVNTSEGIVMIDTPWNYGQTEELINLCNEIFEADFKLAIVTHAHSDTIGGIDKLLEEDIEVISTSKTVKEAEKNGFSLPEPELSDHSTIEVGDLTIETYYPGKGHTSDNIVVYLRDNKLLFGGCLVKSLESTDLGNTAEADLEEWSISVNRVKNQYPGATIVVPGHGEFGDMGLLDHTLELLQ